MKRTDIHRQSAIVPADYVFVSCSYPNDEAGMLRHSAATFYAHMERTGGKFANIERERGGCDICGAYCMYTARFYHEKTNTYIVTGLDCAEKLDMGDAHAFASFRKLVRAGLEAAAGKAKAQRLLEERGLGAAWALYVADYDTLTIPEGTRGGQRLPYEEDTIRDIVGKMVRYGSISDGQTSFVCSLLAKINGRAAVAAAKAAESEKFAPVPVTDKRIEIVGKVLTKKAQESQFGVTMKMLVQHESGFKVWGTVPREANPNCGDVVAFFARVEPSKTDPKFGFYNRPTKARIVSTAQVTP